MRRSGSETREHVLAVTHDLFYWHGIRAVGVDRIAAEASVAPTTLYRLFASKDDLIGAYVERADRLYRAWFDDAVAAGGPYPRDQILALFAALGEQVQPGQCRGCPFLMALAEFPDSTHPAHAHAVAMKAWVRGRLGELVDELAETVPVSDPAQLADRLNLIMEGTYASVQALGADGPASQAQELAAMLLPTPVASGDRGAGRDDAPHQPGRRPDP